MQGVPGPFASLILEVLLLIYNLLNHVCRGRNIRNSTAHMGGKLRSETRLTQEKGRKIDGVCVLISDLTYCFESYLIMENQISIEKLPTQKISPSILPKQIVQHTGTFHPREEMLNH